MGYIKKSYILKIIKAIRESTGGTIAIYRYGNCYQFYEILKSIFSDAEAYYDGSHVWTYINGEYYDIMGSKPKKINENNFIHISDPNLIQSLTKNKWTDIARKKYCDKINTKSYQKKYNMRTINKFENFKEDRHFYIVYTFHFSVGNNTHKLEFYDNYSKEGGVKNKILEFEHSRYTELIKQVKNYLTKEQKNKIIELAKEREDGCIIGYDGKIIETF